MAQQDTHLGVYRLDPSAPILSGRAKRRTARYTRPRDPERVALAEREERRAKLHRTADERRTAAYERALENRRRRTDRESQIFEAKRHHKVHHRSYCKPGRCVTRDHERAIAASASAVYGVSGTGLDHEDT